MSHDLRIERLIDATPEAVFDALTDAEALEDWYRIEDGWVVEAITDPRVGGTATISFGPQDASYREDLTYLEIDRPSRIVYAEVFTMPDGSTFSTTVTMTLEDRDGKTLLTLVQTDFPDAGVRDAHQGGWPAFLDRLERVAGERRVA